MYITRTGILKPILKPEQYDALKEGNINFDEINLSDTIREFETKDEKKVEYLPFKISYKDVDYNGKEKYIYNEETQEFQVNYFTTPVIYAYGKEMRILLELGALSPVKIVYEETYQDKHLYRSAICIQNQRSGCINDK